ncbi:MAG: peptidase dimerization domain-containing protein [Alistipes onderdonkii]
MTRLIALNHEECVLSIGRIEAGGATNIVPDEVYLEGTLRTFDEREREIIHQRIRQHRRRDRQAPGGCGSPSTSATVTPAWSTTNTS